MPLLNRSLAAPLALASVCAALFAGSVSGLHAQTIVYRRAIKLPTYVAGRAVRPVNDSGLGATDLDEQSTDLSKSRYLYTTNSLHILSENGDGTASFGSAIISGIQYIFSAGDERHLNKNPYFQQFGITVLFGIPGLNFRYNEITPQGQVATRYETHLPSLSCSRLAPPTISPSWRLKPTSI